jgi:hypothetical protein
MTRSRRGPAPVVRAAGRGLVAAMAMTGVRTITSNLGLVEESPPRKIVEQHGPHLVRRLPEQYREAATEVAHWCYGTGGGLMYGLLPAVVRRHPTSGPVYGLAIWIAFELGIAPLLGIQHSQRRVLGRVVLFLDHVLYGVVVGGRLAPEPEITEAAVGGSGRPAAQPARLLPRAR